MKKSKIETFTKVPDLILSSSTLTPSQKLIVCYVLRWQSSGKVCFESNNTLAKKFGISLSGIKKQITQLNKLPFFVSEETSGLNAFGKWSNSKKMTVNREKLNIFLESESLKTLETIKKEVSGLTLDNPIEFTEYVKEITNGQSNDKSILYYYELMKTKGYLRSKENIQVLFSDLITPASLPFRSPSAPPT